MEEEEEGKEEKKGVKVVNFVYLNTHRERK